MDEGVTTKWHLVLHQIQAPLITSNPEKIMAT